MTASPPPSRETVPGSGTPDGALPVFPVIVTKKLLGEDSTPFTPKSLAGAYTAGLRETPYELTCDTPAPNTATGVEEPSGESDWELPVTFAGDKTR